jgi:hypothetical protein
MAATKDLWKRAWKDCTPIKARVLPGLLVLVIGAVLRVWLFPGDGMKADIVNGLVAAIGALLVYGGITFLWHLWLAPFSLLEESLQKVLSTVRDSQPERDVQGRIARFILSMAALRGEEIICTENVVKLSESITFGEVGRSNYPTCRAAVLELLEVGFIEALSEPGRFRVSDRGHQRCDRLGRVDRSKWASQGDDIPYSE